MSGWLDKLKIAWGSGPAPRSVTELGTDMHAHWIPGIDDGAKTMDEALSMLQGMATLGFTTCIATPHIMADYYRNTPQGIREGLENVRAAARAAGLSLRLEAAAEYYLDEQFVALLEKGDMLTFGADYLLFELSYVNRPSNFQTAIFQIQTHGYQPVLAHPERYPYFSEDGNLTPFREMADQGVLLQLNLGSLTGQHGPFARHLARELVDAQLVHFAGTDVHRASQTRDLEQLRTDRWFHKLLDSGRLLNAGLAANVAE